MKTKSMFARFLSVAVGALALMALVMAPVAQAQLVSDPGGFTPPAGLNEGDTYHLVFVSSTRRNATSTDIADYNTHVQSAANAAGIGNSVGVTWKAIGSTSTVNAKDNAPVSGPVYLVHATAPILIVTQPNFYTYFSHVAAINRTEDGNLKANNPAGWAKGVWSGSEASGAKQDNHWLGAAATVAFGMFDNSASRAWLYWEHNTAPLSDQYPLYGLSEPLTVSSGASSTPGTLIYGK